MVSPRWTAIPGWASPSRSSRRSCGRAGEAGHAVRAERRAAHEVGDGLAGDERSAGLRCGRHAGEVLLAWAGSASSGGPSARPCAILPLRSRPSGRGHLHLDRIRGPRMARSCAICGKVSMGGFNPQSSGMNRVRAHRRMKPNLQPLVIDVKGTADQVARLHPLPPHAAEVGQVRPPSPSLGGRPHLPDARAPTGRAGDRFVVSRAVAHAARWSSLVDPAGRGRRRGASRRRGRRPRRRGSPRRRPSRRRRDPSSWRWPRIGVARCASRASAGSPWAISASATASASSMPSAFELGDQLGRLASVDRSEVADPLRFGGRRRARASGSSARVRPSRRLRRLRRRGLRRPSIAAGAARLADPIGQRRLDRTLLAGALDRLLGRRRATGTARAPAAARTRSSGSCRR